MSLDKIASQIAAPTTPLAGHPWFAPPALKLGDPLLCPRIVFVCCLLVTINSQSVPKSPSTGNVEVVCFLEGRKW